MVLGQERSQPAAKLVGLRLHRPLHDIKYTEYRGDLLPYVVEGASGLLFVDFFRIDRNAGTLNSKGIVLLDPRRVP